MKAVVMNRTGGPDALEFVERPETAPTSGQVLVEVAAAGVNFMDIGVRQGMAWTETPNPKRPVIKWKTHSRNPCIRKPLGSKPTLVGDSLTIVSRRGGNSATAHMARIIIKRKGKVIFSENRTFDRKQGHTLGWLRQSARRSGKLSYCRIRKQTLDSIRRPSTPPRCDAGAKRTHLLPSSPK